MKKLNARGFSHDLLVVAFVVIFAIAGVAYLVASHADSCSAVSGAVSEVTSDPTSDIASGEVSAPAGCTPASGAVSTPVSNPTVTTLSCVINGISATPSYGQQIQPSAVVTNTGSAAAQLTARAQLYVTSGLTIDQPVSISVQPGQSTTVALPAFTVPYAQLAGQPGTYTLYNASNTPVLRCAFSFTLPLPSPAATRKPLYELWNNVVSDHMLTTSKAEHDQLIRSGGYVDQGIIGYVAVSPSSGSVPLYRLYSRQSSDHFYTDSEAQRANAKSSFRHYVDEGVIGYVTLRQSNTNEPLYQLWSNTYPDHFYTTNPRLKAAAIASFRHYVSQGNAGYVYRSAQ